MQGGGGCVRAAEATQLAPKIFLKLKKAYIYNIKPYILNHWSKNKYPMVNKNI